MGEVLKSGTALLQSGTIISKKVSNLHDTKTNAEPCLLIVAILFKN